MDKSPAFQFYPKDFLTDEKVSRMTREEIGDYVYLLCMDWINDGIDEALLKGTSSMVQGCFNKSGERWFNPRLIIERKKQKAWKEKCKRGGVESGKARKQKDISSKVSSRVVEVNANSSSSSSSSSSKNDLKDKTLAPSPSENEVATQPVTPNIDNHVDNNTPVKKKRVYMIGFDFNTGTFTGLTDSMFDVWRKAYPAVDIESEINKAAAWQASNTKKIKKDYKAFLNNWLGRVQERGGSIGFTQPKQDAPSVNKREFEPYEGKVYSFLDVPDNYLKPHEVKEKHRILAERAEKEQAGK